MTKCFCKLSNTYNQCSPSENSKKLSKIEMFFQVINNLLQIFKSRFKSRKYIKELFEFRIGVLK